MSDPSSGSIRAPGRDLIRALLQVVHAANPDAGAKLHLQSGGGVLTMAVIAPDGETVARHEIEGAAGADLAPTDVHAGLFRDAINKGTVSGVTAQEVEIAWDGTGADLEVRYPDVAKFHPVTVAGEPTTALPELSKGAGSTFLHHPDQWEHLTRCAGVDGSVRLVRLAGDHEEAYAVRPDGAATAVRFGMDGGTFSHAPDSQSLDPDDLALFDLDGRTVRAVARGLAAETQRRKDEAKAEGRRRGEIDPVRFTIVSEPDSDLITVTIDGGAVIRTRAVMDTRLLDRTTLEEGLVPSPNSDEAEERTSPVDGHALLEAVEWAVTAERQAGFETGRPPSAGVVAVDHSDGTRTVRVDRPMPTKQVVLEDPAEKAEYHVGPDGDFNVVIRPEDGAEGEFRIGRCNAVDLLRALEIVGARKTLRIGADARGGVVVSEKGFVVRLPASNGRSAMSDRHLRHLGVHRIGRTRVLASSREIDAIREEDEQRMPQGQPTYRGLGRNRAARLADEGTSPWWQAEHERMMRKHEAVPEDAGSIEEIVTAANATEDPEDAERLRTLAFYKWYPVTLSWTGEARKRGNPIAFEDLHSVAKGALWKAIKTWEPGKAPVIGLARFILSNDNNRQVPLEGGFQLSMNESRKSSADLISATRQRLREELGCEPLPHEILDSMNTTRMCDVYGWDPEDPDDRAEMLDLVEDVVVGLDSARALSAFGPTNDRESRRNASMEGAVARAMTDEVVLRSDAEPYDRPGEDPDKLRFDRFLSALTSEQEDLVRALTDSGGFPMSKDEWALYRGTTAATASNRLDAVDERLKALGVEGRVMGPALFAGH